MRAAASAAIGLGHLHGARFRTFECEHDVGVAIENEGRAAAREAVRLGAHRVLRAVGGQRTGIGVGR